MCMSRRWQKNLGNKSCSQKGDQKTYSVLQYVLHLFNSGGIFSSLQGPLMPSLYSPGAFPRLSVTKQKIMRIMAGRGAETRTPDINFAFVTCAVHLHMNKTLLINDTIYAILWLTCYNKVFKHYHPLVEPTVLPFSSQLSFRHQTHDDYCGPVMFVSYCAKWQQLTKTSCLAQNTTENRSLKTIGKHSCFGICCFKSLESVIRQTRW